MTDNELEAWLLLLGFHREKPPPGSMLWLEYRHSTHYFLYVRIAKAARGAGRFVVGAKDLHTAEAALECVNKYMESAND